MAKDRATFQELARRRHEEARLLIREGHFSGAYYLLGYAIECALKARIAGQFRGGAIPDKNLVNKIYTHNLSDLLRLSGLQTELEAAETDPNLARGWSIIKNWSENARYAMYDEGVAVEMLNAVDGEHGLLQWLINRW